MTVSTPLTTDPSRIIGQVITGIGFLGAGVMLARDGMVMGVTSAATIWTLASVGVCIAIGYDITAIKLSLVVVAVLVGVDLMEDEPDAPAGRVVLCEPRPPLPARPNLERLERCRHRGVASGPGGYSCRRAIIGSMREARRAGTKEASAATPASVKDTTAAIGM